VRQLAAAFAQASLLAVYWSAILRRASSQEESGSKLPHSRAPALIVLTADDVSSIDTSLPEQTASSPS